MTEERNKTLEEVAQEFDKMKSLGDTSQSFAAYVRNMKTLAQPEQEPVAWIRLDLDGMAEAFNRVIEEHHLRTNPFHDPVNRDAMIALRELRGCIAYMKRNTSPPQRKPLSDEEIDALSREMVKGNKSVNWLCRAIEAALRSKNT